MSKIYTVIPFFNNESYDINHNLVKSFNTFNSAESYLENIKVSYGVMNVEIIENEIVK